MVEHPTDVYVVNSLSLDNFDQELRDYQRDTVQHAYEFVGQCEANGLHGNAARVLYASPTGTGKGSMELALHQRLRADGLTSWILTPSLEVLRGFLARCGASREELAVMSAEGLAELGEAVSITTPTRFRNRILESVYEIPDVIIYDEVHHAIVDNEVSGVLFATAPEACWVGFTATPYRGSPRSTAKLREAWGEPWEVMTIPEAVEAGYYALPTFEIVPLVDDDQVTVRQGKFVGKSATKFVGRRMKQIAELVADRRALDVLADPVPTTVVVPSTECAGQLQHLLTEECDVPADFVHQATKAQDRAAAYERCRTGASVLVVIGVLSEGVDLPWLGRIFDCSPTLSAVVFVQRIGRETRPKPRRPEYICVCRNLERHAYTLQGAVPREKVGEAQEAFEKPSKRAAHRAFGLEALAKFRALSLPLAGGVKGTMNALYTVDKDTGVTTEFVAVVDPAGRCLVASRSVQPFDEANPQDTSRYGRWRRCEMPADMTGFATSGRNDPLSEKQKEFWTKCAKRVGLDVDAVDEVKKRQFAALPFLLDTKQNLLDLEGEL